MHRLPLLDYCSCPQPLSACLAVLQPGEMQAAIRELLCKLGEVTNNPSLQQQMLVAAFTYMRTAMPQVDRRVRPTNMVCILRTFALVLHIPCYPYACPWHRVTMSCPDMRFYSKHCWLWSSGFSCCFFGCIGGVSVWHPLLHMFNRQPCAAATLRL